MDKEENVNTEKAMAINSLCGFAELSAHQDTLWEEWWSVDITASKKIYYWGSDKSLWNILEKSLFYLLILLYWKKKHNIIQNQKLKWLWLDMTGWEGV